MLQNVPYPISCAITRHGVRNFTVDGMIRDTKHWISREQSISFPWNKKILQLRLYFLKLIFLAEVNFRRWWYTPSFYKQRVFSTQLQCCSTFSWIELQMLLRCCLIYISIIILTSKVLYIYYIVFVSSSRICLFMSYLLLSDIFSSSFSLWLIV